MILIDKREPDRIIKKLKSKAPEVEEQFIEVGDYLLDDGFAIERKDNDLLASIMSNRLYDQLNNLCEYEHPILCIIMEDKWKNFYHCNSKWIHKAYAGTLTTLACSYPKLKIFQFDDEDEFISFLVGLDKKIHKEGKSERPAPIYRKTKNIKIRKEDALTAIEGVSVGKAKKLLQCFGSIRNIANANLEELKLVDGIGDKLAEKIRDTLN